MKQHIYLSVILGASYLSIVSCFPVVAIAGGLVAGGSVVGLYSGARQGSYVAEHPGPDGKERSKEEKTKIMRAGMAKGIIDGVLFVPNLVIGPATNIAGNKAAADILELKNQTKLLEASALAGIPGINLTPQGKAHVFSRTLGDTDTERAKTRGFIAGAGELDALVQRKDRESQAK